MLLRMYTRRHTRCQVRLLRQAHLRTLLPSRSYRLGLERFVDRVSFADQVTHHSYQGKRFLHNGRGFVPENALLVRGLALNRGIDCGNEEWKDGGFQAFTGRILEKHPSAYRRREVVGYNGVVFHFSQRTDCPGPRHEHGNGVANGLFSWLGF